MKTCFLPTEIINNKPLTDKRTVTIEKYFETIIRTKNNIYIGTLYNKLIK